MLAPDLVCPKTPVSYVLTFVALSGDELSLYLAHLIIKVNIESRAKNVGTRDTWTSDTNGVLLWYCFHNFVRLEKTKFSNFAICYTNSNKDGVPMCPAI